MEKKRKETEENYKKIREESEKHAN